MEGQQHKFVVDDKNNPLNEDIRSLLQLLHTDMKKVGYAPDVVTFVRDDIPKAQEVHLCFHSERMAIGFGILKTPPLTPLIVFQNDC